MTTKSEILKIEQLIASYPGKQILNGINLSLHRGEICCIVGEEGAGKSTLLKAITQQIRTEGTILCNGYNLKKVTTEKMISYGVDFIMQGGNILKGFTVEEHIDLALSGKSKADKSILWKEIQQVFPNMITLKKQVGGRLSGGERMILSIACMIATDADFLILDEPTAGLAQEICNIIGDFLLRMKNERDKTILLLEHHYDFTFEIADTIAILKNGKLSHKFDKSIFQQKDFVDSNIFN